MTRRSESERPARLFVDSGTWLAFFSARDGHHVEADRLIRAAFEHKIPLLTTNLVLAEVHRLLAHRAGSRSCGRGAGEIDLSGGVSIKFADALVHQHARQWLARLSGHLINYTDAASFAVMKANKCGHVIGFDRDFAVAGFSLWSGAR